MPLKTTGNETLRPALEQGITLLDYWGDDPESIYNMLPESMREKIADLDLELLQLTDKAFMRKFVKAVGEEPNETDMVLREAFWSQYNANLITIRARKYQQRAENIIKIDITQLAQAAGYSRHFFYESYLLQPMRIAYLLRPPTEYMYRMQSLLDLSLRKLHEILNMPLTRTVMKRAPSEAVAHDELAPPHTPTGAGSTGDKQIERFIAHEEANTPLIGKIIDIAKFLDLRVKGAIIQKIQIDQKVQQRNLNLNINKNQNEEQDTGYDIDLDSMSPDEQLKVIEKKIAALKSGGGDSGRQLFEGSRVIELEDEGVKVIRGKGKA